MNRQSPYPDATPVPYANSHQLHQISTQGIQQGIGMSIPMGRLVPAEHDHYHRNPVLSHPYPEARGDAARPLHQLQLPDPTTHLQNAGYVDRLEAHEQDMEIGYEDNPTPLTFEALEKRFQDETLKLLKEQVDAEDAEINRHREKIVEINNEYREKLSILRAKQASQRKEFLLKESEARVQSQQQGEASYLLGKAGPIDSHGYIAEPTGYLARKLSPIDGRGYVTEPTGPDAYRAFSAVQFNDQRDRPSIHVVDKNQRAAGRVPMPRGRVYNNSGAGL